MMIIVVSCASLPIKKISTPKCSDFVEDLIKKSEKGVLVEALETLPSDPFNYLDLIECVELNLAQ